MLLTRDLGALWVTSYPLAEFTKHEWAGAWTCTCFRRERGEKASELIRQAVAVTRYAYPETPPLGMVTFINRDKVKPIIRRGRKIWGYTYWLAGFRECGETGSGLLAMQLLPKDMPEPYSPQRTFGFAEEFPPAGLTNSEPAPII